MWIENFRKLKKDDFRLLRFIEKEMISWEWVPLDLIARKFKIGMDEARFSVGRLREMKFLSKTSAPYEGARLTFYGYDCLAVRSLVDRGMLDAFCGKIGVGKESEVYKVICRGEETTLKLHRIGLTSFKHARRKREHLNLELENIFLAKRNAEREFEGLQLLYPKVAVPKPIARNRHAVLMSLLRGVELVNAVVKNPSTCLSIIIEEVEKAYDCGVIHGDLSEFNVLISSDGVTLIDWCQWIPTDHPMADHFLRRDVSNIISYFRRKYKVERNVENVIARIKCR